jgi:hypothetical protein
VHLTRAFELLFRALRGGDGFSGATFVQCRGLQFQLGALHGGHGFIVFLPLPLQVFLGESSSPRIAP